MIVALSTYATILTALVILIPALLDFMQEAKR